MTALCNHQSTRGLEEDQKRCVTILHFNDVYNIDAHEDEPIGGAARFATAIARRRHLNPLVLFSGDAFNPSLMSAVTKGEQMVPVLNAFNVQCAVFGNHDFDFGIGHLVQLMNATTFPWLLSNVYDNTTDDTLAGGLSDHLITWNGIMFGLVGLVEAEWTDTLPAVDPDELQFVDYVREGCKLAGKLKRQGAQFVIALTHMRWPNDIRLAESVPEIDLILGGHDHDYNVKKVAGRYIVKSGTDFRNLSQLTLTFDQGHCVEVKVEKVTVDSSLEEDVHVKNIVHQYTELMDERMERILGRIDVDLDGRFSKIRTQETNLGNFITDIMLMSSHADLAILNSGTFRSDTIHRVGDFRTKDLLSILPLVDPLVVLKVMGSQIVEALENGVSQYPKNEGRFPQVAGVKFAFDPQNPSKKRIDPKYVWIQGEKLDLKKEYRLCTKLYLFEGRDGYDVLKSCPVLVNEDDGPRLSTAVRNHFKSVEMLRDCSRGRFFHRQSIIPLKRRKTLVRQLSVDEMDTSTSPISRSLPVTRPLMSSKSHMLLQRRHSIESLELETVVNALAPRVEGRIVILTDEKRQQFDAEVTVSSIAEVSEHISVDFS